MTREEAKRYIGELKMYAKSQGWDEEYQIACYIAMNELEQKPILDKYQAEIDHLHKYIARLETQITDSFINKSCVSEKVCEHDKNVVIDKIRAEIEKLSRFEIRGEVTPLVNVNSVLAILDKYKAESEEVK